MFIKPNEFEPLLAARIQPPVPRPAPTYLRIVVGSVALAVLVPLMMIWLGAISIAVTGTIAFRTLRSAIRFAGQAAEHAGLLIVG